MTDGDRTPARNSGSRVRLARLARNLTQEQLARAADVTRQSIAGIESGRWEPSLRVAIAIANAMGAHVEELFAAAEPLDSLVARLEVGEEPPLRSRLAVADLGRSIAAFPLQGHSSLLPGMTPAHAVVERVTRSPSDTTLQVQAKRLPGQPLPLALTIAGCDPAIPLLAPMLARLSPPVELVWVNTNNSEAAELLARGAVHVAGLHSDSCKTPAWQRTEFGSGQQQPLAVIGFSSWREGIVLSSGLDEKVTTFRDIAAQGLRIANREKGSRARDLLDAQCRSYSISPEELAGYQSAVRGHMLVASAIASGLADAGIASEPAAACFGLGFLELARENFDFVLRRDDLPTPVVQALLDVLGGKALQAQLESIPGYDPARCGEVIAEQA